MTSIGDRQRAAVLRLVRASGLGPMRLRPLLDAFGNAGDFLDAAPREWSRHGLDAAAIKAIQAVDDADIEHDLDWLAAPGRHLVMLGEPGYPEHLAREPSAPLALFCRGDPEVLSQPQLAIVGSRNATVQGIDNATAFAAELGRCGLVITSGLALGIDAAAHDGALQAGGLTLAVCATGLDRVYPARHRELAQRIEAEGALVSEFPPGVGVRAEHFPRRNRIISALALGVLVVEAAERSGSLITGRYAVDQGRELFAIPGSIHNPMARGCHRLIRQGAKLVETAADVLEEIGPALAERPRPMQPEASTTAENASDDARQLLARLGDAPTSVDRLAEALGWPVPRLTAALLELEMAERIARGADGSYMRRGSGA